MLSHYGLNSFGDFPSSSLAKKKKNKLTPMKEQQYQQSNPSRNSNSSPKRQNISWGLGVEINRREGCNLKQQTAQSMGKNKIKIRTRRQTASKVL